MYAVDNTAEYDEEIEKLKQNVGGYMKDMARTVPINWVEFQVKVLELGKTTLRMALDKIIVIAVECGINKEQAIHVITYLNDLGIILYLPNNKRLKNTVITNIQMLIGIFVKIITIVKSDDVDKVPMMIPYWNELDDKGILPEPLARHLWRNELTACEENDDVIFEDFIELMKTFGLLCEKNASEDGTRLFVIPSRMKTKTNNRLEIKEDDEQTVSIYVTPKDFLPDAVYDILVVRFVNLSQDKGCCDDPNLFQNQSTIRFGDEHFLRLGRISIDNKPSLKLEVSRMEERDVDGKAKPACKPQPDVCQEVLHVLKQQLDEVYPSKEVVGYSLNILCLICVNSEEPHFQELENCIKNKNMTCDKTGKIIAMSTANVQKVFKGEWSVNVQKRKMLHSVQKRKISHKKAKTCDKKGEQMAMKPGLSDMKFGVLKSVVSDWYDRHRSLSMLKVLFRDKVENGKLSTVTDTMELLNNLFRHDHLSLQNLKILCDTISITEHFALQWKIKENLSSFPDVKKGTISEIFTVHRQKLMKFGMELTPADVTLIDGLYNTPRKDYADAWSMITDLENRLIISKRKMKKFIDSLKILNLSGALNALT
ncbi:uncharacterized protein LOC117110639 [Anneissia japonica]|uniref:uncharacterized protein LOC117110639 n=1 Tax=Anneissia japonica TaxID=1529436 RepID=UPI0014257818|nr:uncharacterized protein LOC117110639 [Anneissia japonica]